MKPNAYWASRAARSAIASTPSRGSADSTAARIRPELAVPAFGVGGQAVVALGQLGDGVVALDRDRLAHVAGRDARHRGRDLVQRRDELEADREPPRTPTTTATATMKSSRRVADLRIDRTGDHEQGPEQRRAG